MRLARFAPITVVSIAVAMNVASAILLKTLADTDGSNLLLLVGGLTIVLLINLGRLAVWGYAHRKFPLSHSYPFSSLFFPAMLLVALAYGETVRASEVLGVVLITVGAAWLTLTARS